MNMRSEPSLQSIDQSAVADELAAALIAVVSDASSADSALAGLKKARDDSVPAAQRAAVAALQAYGAECAADVLAAGLDPEAKDRAGRLHDELEAESGDDILALLRSDGDAAREFTSRLSLRIADRCAEMVAAEIERDKQGRFTILNEEDAAIFASQREAHRAQRVEAASSFLASLPQRYPSFGAALFADIRSEVQRQVEERHKRPDIHEAVASLFQAALDRMPAPAREAVERAGQPRH
ncbi:hypothetical protein NCCP691_02820 [Noviherbaspirillum aridicola]|uniref:Uncharacterized protein n=2 Tax=Noviherbaspirillum aridicola TaxID=2849687 RepID=A0ABQ4PZF5_9BURK|nr:hypothetical protein NCCP691_02820 [Noviherbaspirillum aridicola]